MHPEPSSLLSWLGRPHFFLISLLQPCPTCDPDLSLSSSPLSSDPCCVPLGGGAAPVPLCVRLSGHLQVSCSLGHRDVQKNTEI